MSHVQVTKYIQKTRQKSDFLKKQCQNGQLFVKICCPYLTTLVSGSPLYSFAVQALPLGAMHSARLLTSHRGAICARSLVQAQTRLRLIIIKRQARRRATFSKKTCHGAQRSMVTSRADQRSHHGVRHLRRKHAQRRHASHGTGVVNRKANKKVVPI